MERNLSEPLSQIPEEIHEDISNVAESSSVQQSGQGQRDHPTQPDAAHVQQPRISARVSQQQFKDSVMLLCRDMARQNGSAYAESGLQRRAAIRKIGPPRSQQQFHVNNALSKTCRIAVSPQSTESGGISKGASQESSGQSCVEKQREAEQVRSKAHSGNISSPIQPQASQGSHKSKSAIFKVRVDSDQPFWRRDLLRRALARRRQRKAASDNEPAFYFQNEQGLLPPPNWPFGVNPRSSRNIDSRGTQHQPLSQREIRLLLRNPLIRDGNMGPLPTPDGVKPLRPPPHIFGITSGPGREPHLPVPRLTVLKRRNAQRKSPKSPLQQKFESYDDRFNARFRRGSAARDFHVDYGSLVELARCRSVMARIEEVSDESPDGELAHNLAEEGAIAPDTPEADLDDEKLLDDREHRGGGEAEARRTDENPRHPWPTTDEHDASSGQKKTRHRNRSIEPDSTGAHKAPTPRRFPRVVRGPRPAPASLSASSSAPSPSQSSPPLTATTQASTPAPGPEPEPKSEPEPVHLTQNGPGCGTPGCTWADCSRLRGTSRMPVPGAAGASRSEEDGSGSTAEASSEDDIVPVSNGFSFLTLN